MLYRNRKLDPTLKRLMRQTHDANDRLIEVLVRVRPGYRFMGKKFESKYFNNIDIVKLTLSPRAILLLTRDPKVEYIAQNAKVRVVMDVASRVVGTPPLLREGLTGKGVTVAVVDTGIYSHPDLRGRVIAFHDTVNGKKNPYDDHGHGTHVAGVLAGSGRMSQGKYRGIAPGVRLVGIKVLDKNGDGQTSDIIEGIDWAISNRDRFGMRSMVLSLGGPTRSHHRFDPLSAAVARATKAGIAVFVAAGNGGPGEKTIYTPGIAPSVITVGAMDDRTTADLKDDKIADISSRGPTPAGIAKPDLVAPGVKITSLFVPGGNLYNEGDARVINRYYSTLTGTSSATPVIAGIAALLLQEYPNLTPHELKIILQRSATLVSGNKYAEGAGLPNAKRAREIAEEYSGSRKNAKTDRHK